MVKDIVINDLDKGIYSFWRAILTETDRFINDVQTVDLTIQEWQIREQSLKNVANIVMNLDSQHFI